ncbi:DUF721 domain-containing protein [Desulfosoma caldarium]|uniref:Uncharacterized protein DUF721 n=1 Tax=Desulfosoma caldarium TaxID=610254 RepID=A0A3N1UKI0_9BACT|nr:DUF721 domain-containing protein [Desulfosoma caldarium]ROQ89889.1 uncharacterized protein DUF721 [Desulfosoma caldarium]
MPKDLQKRTSNPQAVPLGQFIKEVLAQQPSFASKPLGEWKDLVGESVARHCAPRSLKNGRLVVVARDSVWKHHLELNKEALVRRINERWGRRVVAEIRVRVGEIEEVSAILDANYKRLQKIKPKKAPKRKKKPLLRKLTDAEKEFIASLKDKDLQKMATKLLRLTHEEPTEFLKSSP